MLRLELDFDGTTIDFPINHEQSYIEGTILADEPDTIYWSIEIECLETMVPYDPDEIDEDESEDVGYMEDCHLEISGLVFPLNEWRELAGKTAEVVYASEEVHPILPDSPGNVYFASEHHVPNNNCIQFGDREGCQFTIEWSCKAERYAGEDGPRIEVKTSLPLRQFQVYFREPGAVSLDVARQLVLRFARTDDIGEPVQRTPQWVVVLVRSDVP